MPMTTNRPKSKSEVEFQYSGRSFSQIGHHSSVVNGSSFYHEIWYADTNVSDDCRLKSKPEV